MTSFSMYAGDTKVLAFDVKDPDGAVVDLAGFAITWVLTRSVGRRVLVRKTLGAGILVTDETGGLFEVTLDSADTEDLVGVFYYEAEIALLTEVGTVASGHITIAPTSIRPPD